MLYLATLFLPFLYATSSDTYPFNTFMDHPHITLKASTSGNEFDEGHQVSRAGNEQILDQSVEMVQGALLNFMKWCPPLAQTGKGGSMSPGTMKPQTFSQHLHPDLTLKSVVHAPQIAGLLVGLAVKHIQNTPLTNEYCPPISSLSFPRSLPDPKKGSHVLREASLVSTYMRYARYALAIAVTLEYKLDEWSSKPFYWDNTSTRSVAAEGDGAIHMREDELEEGADNGLDATYEHFRELGTWEFKSLAACSLDVMEAIQELAHGPANGFAWTGCEQECAHVHQSVVDPHSAEMRGARVGVDSRTGLAAHIKGTTCSCNHPPPPTSFSPAGPSARTNPKSSVARRRTPASSKTQQERRAATMAKKTADASVDAEKEAKTAANKKLKARYIIQQVWSEAVNLDNTYIILNAGNFEIIGIRCRDTNTLYLSSIIRPDSFRVTAQGFDGHAGYGALHVGLMLSIILDARSRSLKMQKLLKARERIPESWTRHYDQAIRVVMKKPADLTQTSKSDHDLCFQRRKTLFLKRDPAPDENFGAMNNTYLVVDDFADTTRWRSFPVLRNTAYSRSDPPEVYHGSLSMAAGGAGDVIRVSLHTIVDRITANAFTIPHLSFLKQKFIFPESRGFIVKVAADSISVQKLVNEFRFYSYMDGRGMKWLPRVVGLYSRTDQDGIDHFAVVMEDVGPEVDESMMLNETETNVLRDRLGQIHQQGLLHGPFSKDNIRKNTTHGYVIVSWINSRPRTSLHTRDFAEIEQEQENMKTTLQMVNARDFKRIRLVPPIPKSRSVTPAELLDDVLSINQRTEPEEEARTLLSTEDVAKCSSMNSRNNTKRARDSET